MQNHHEPTIVLTCSLHFGLPKMAIFRLYNIIIPIFKRGARKSFTALKTTTNPYVFMPFLLCNVHFHDFVRLTSTFLRISVPLYTRFYSLVKLKGTFMATVPFNLKIQREFSRLNFPEFSSARVSRYMIRPTKDVLCV